MTIYDEMALMAEELLGPPTQGGLGQGTVVIRRESVVVNSDEPWVPAEPLIQEETVRAVVQALTQKDGSSTYSDGTTVMVGDLVITCSVPKSIDWTLGSDNGVLFVIIDGGRKVPVVQTTTIPAAGTPVVIKLFARGVS